MAAGIIGSISSSGSRGIFQEGTMTEASRQAASLFLKASLYSLLLMAILALPIEAGIYKWVDEKGVVHFSDQPPEKKDDDLAVESMPSAPPSTWQAPAEEKTGLPKQDGEKASALPPKREALKKTRPVELYVTSWCKYCRLAQEFLHSRKIPFVAYDVEKDAQAAKRRRTLHKSSGVPLAVINGHVILGFSQDSYLQALNAQ